MTPLERVTDHCPMPDCPHAVSAVRDLSLSQRDGHRSLVEALADHWNYAHRLCVPAVVDTDRVAS